MSSWRDGWSLEDNLILLSVERERQKQKLFSNLKSLQTISAKARQVTQELEKMMQEAGSHKRELQLLKPKLDATAARFGLNSIP